jgi:hypothetical protein
MPYVVHSKPGPFTSQGKTMLRGAIPQKLEWQKLTRTEQKTADTDAFVKRELLQSRAADGSKMSELKALRLARNARQRPAIAPAEDAHPRARHARCRKLAAAATDAAAKVKLPAAR